MTGWFDTFQLNSINFVQNFGILNTNTSKLFINQPLLPPTVICAHERPEESLSMGKPIAAYSVLQMYYPTIIWMKRTLIITRDIGRHVYHCVSGATITSIHGCTGADCTKPSVLHTCYQRKHLVLAFIKLRWIFDVKIG